MGFYNLLPWSKRNISNQRGELSAEYRPDDSLRNLHHDINKLFDEFFGREENFFPAAFSNLGPMAATSIFSQTYPKLDFVETENEFRISAELPGLSDEDVELNVGQDLLTIRGEKKEEKVADDKGWYRMERQYGLFSRSIPLPPNVNVGGIEASMKNGVLTVNLPKKAEELKSSRSISIKKE